LHHVRVCQRTESSRLAKEMAKSLAREYLLLF
jgi:hypothetical protein